MPVNVRAPRGLHAVVRDVMKSTRDGCRPPRTAGHSCVYFRYSRLADSRCGSLSNPAQGGSGTHGTAFAGLAGRECGQRRPGAIRMSNSKGPPFDGCMFSRSMNRSRRTTRSQIPHVGAWRRGKRGGDPLQRRVWPNRALRPRPQQSAAASPPCLRRELPQRGQGCAPIIRRLDVVINASPLGLKRYPRPVMSGGKNVADLGCDIL